MTNAGPLELHDVSLRVGTTDILTRINLRVDAGELVALIGPSGAGKSSLISVANASVLATGGTARLFGEDARTLRGRGARRRVRSRVGTVQQQPQLPGSLQVVHNVNAGRLGTWSLARSLWSLLRPTNTGEVQAALRRLGIADLMHARTDTLSGGEQQRVALARLLVARPSLVLADEPVSAVDPAWSREVLRVMAELARDGAGVLVAIHDIDLALASVDRVVGLRSGEIAFDQPAHAVNAAQLADLYDLTDRTLR